VIIDNFSIIVNKDTKPEILDNITNMYRLITYTLEHQQSNKFIQHLKNLIYTTNMIFKYTEEIPDTQRSSCISGYAMNLINKRS
jgi:flagellin-specific chaperone FliS